jgi:hypothetical protein
VIGQRCPIGKVYVGTAALGCPDERSAPTSVVGQFPGRRVTR